MSACGGGAAANDGFSTGVGPGTPPPQALEILTTSLPDASVGASYLPTQLAATGSSGPLVWQVLSGETPPGMTVTTDGALFGTPTTTGFYSFTVRATDGASTDTQTLGVAVDTFGAFVESGLVHGDAWAGNAVLISYVGAAGPVTVSFAQNGSGGTVLSVDAEARTITYIPGQVYSTQVTDRLTVTDTGSDTDVEIPLTVRPDPLANHIARFGTTDVWKFDFEAKRGTHAFSSDWHATLARIGLRNPTSTGAVGTEADQLADMVCRVAILRRVNQHFLRNSDGSAGAQGLSISFPFEGLAGYSTPTNGGSVSGQAYVYNTMSICDTSGIGALGMAFIDSVGNPSIENNSAGGPAGQLGVFVNRVTDYVIVMFDDYGTQLVSQPVGPSDIESLKALLFETGAAGLRYDMLEYTIEGLAKSLGGICAHEVGHSLGLQHTPTSVPGSLMNYGIPIHEQAEYFFLPGDLAKLQQGLPGPGRIYGAALKADVLPDGGLCSCGG